MYSSNGNTDFSAAIIPVFTVAWMFRNHTNMLLKKRIIIKLLLLYIVILYIIIIIIIIYS